MTTKDTNPEESAFRARVKEAMDLLASIDTDRGLLAELGSEERQRLLDLTRRVTDPDHVARRRLVKATAKQRKAARVQKEEKVLSGTGIRELRRKPVFTTANVYPPRNFIQQDVETEEEAQEINESQHCYVC